LPGTVAEEVLGLMPDVPPLPGKVDEPPLNPPEVGAPGWLPL
jgi:hypothetical protein